MNFNKFNASRARVSLKVTVVVSLAITLILVLQLIFLTKSKNLVGFVAKLPEDRNFNSGETVTLFAPKNTVQAGTLLSEGLFNEVYWPKNQVPEGAVRDLSELKNLYSKSVLIPGRPIQRNGLSIVAPKSFPYIPPGFKAITINVDLTNVEVGWVRPGVRIDLVLTTEKDGKLTSSIIVQNVRVLSVEKETKADIKGRSNQAESGMSTLTIDLLTAQDAMKLQLASQVGRFSIATAAALPGEIESPKEVSRPIGSETIIMDGVEYHFKSGKLVPYKPAE